MFSFRGQIKPQPHSVESRKKSPFEHKSLLIKDLTVFNMSLKHFVLNHFKDLHLFEGYPPSEVQTKEGI